jgi:acyl-CoA thioesterase-1
MRRSGRVGAVAGALLAAVACAGGEAAPKDSVRAAVASDSGADGTPDGGATDRVAPLRVVFVGTSLTAGLGLDPDSAYPALIQRKADSAGVPVTVVNAGVSGETSAGALRRIDWVLREPLDVLVLETGANDGLRALRVDSTRENLAAIVARTRQAHPGARVVVVQMEAPPNLGPEYTARFRAMFPDVARSAGATLTPFLLDRVAGVARLNQGDGIHPNEAGARVVAETVWGTLRSVLDSALATRAAGS